MSEPREDDPTWIKALCDLGACGSAVSWARKRDSYADAWASCPDPSWLVWLLQMCGGTDALASGEWLHGRIINYGDEWFESDDMWRAAMEHLAVCHGLDGAVRLHEDHESMAGMNSKQRREARMKYLCKLIRSLFERPRVSELIESSEDFNRASMATTWCGSDGA